MESTEKNNAQNKERGIDTWKRMTSAVKGEVGEVDQMKEGERINQRTCTHNPSTQKTVWGWVGEWGDGCCWVEADKGGKSRDNCNSINNKI